MCPNPGESRWLATPKIFNRWPRAPKGAVINRYMGVAIAIYFPGGIIEPSKVPLVKDGYFLTSLNLRPDTDSDSSEDLAELGLS